MSSTIQIRVDDELKTKSDTLFRELQKTVQNYKIFLEYANFKQSKVYNPN